MFVVLIVSLSGSGDFLEPQAVAQYGHDGVEGVEAGREGDLLVDIKDGADGIDDEPQ